MLNLPRMSVTSSTTFSGDITLGIVLIYYAQVHFRWLPFTENEGEDVANYIRKEAAKDVANYIRNINNYILIFTNVKGKVVELVILILGRFSIDFRKLL